MPIHFKALILIILLCSPVLYADDNSWKKTLHTPNVTLIPIQRIAKSSHLFTQGLAISDGVLYQSSGGYGKSLLCKIQLSVLIKKNTDDGQDCIALSPDIFAEGISIDDQQIAMLTWKSHSLQIRDKADFTLLSRHGFNGEGWGLTRSDTAYVMSNGSHYLYIRSLDDFSLRRTIALYHHNRRLDRLNELEWINGHIWANRWHSPSVYIIDPNTEKVLSEIDFKHLLPRIYKTNKEAVVNGIAYDSQQSRLLITGKLWPYYYLYRVKNLTE